MQWRVQGDKGGAHESRESRRAPALTAQRCDTHLDAAGERRGNSGCDGAKRAAGNKGRRDDCFGDVAHTRGPGLISGRGENRCFYTPRPQAEPGSLEPDNESPPLPACSPVSIQGVKLFKVFWLLFLSYFQTVLGPRRNICSGVVWCPACHVRSSVELLFLGFLSSLLAPLPRPLPRPPRLLGARLRAKLGMHSSETLPCRWSLLRPAPPRPVFCLLKVAPLVQFFGHYLLSRNKFEYIFT